ncbi:MAG: GntR family transcriptional regulator [Anaerofustis sp.]
MSDVLYLAIVSSLKEKIAKGCYQPGDMLSSESALMSEYHASRMTIRKSLSLLSNEGYIYSVPGKGNFICQPETDIFQFKFNKYDGLNVHIDKVKLLSVKIRYPEPFMQGVLHLQETDKIGEIIRILYSGEREIALERIYFQYIPNQPIVEDLLKYADYLKPVDEKLAFSVNRSIEINVTFPSDELCEKLTIQQTVPVYHISEKITQVDTEDIIQYSIFYIATKYLSIKASNSKDSKRKNIF